MSHFTCWSLPSLCPLKIHYEVVPASCKPKTQSKQPCSPQLFPCIQHKYKQAAFCQIPPLLSHHNPVFLSHCAYHQPSPRLIVHTLTFTPQNPAGSCFKLSKVHTRVAGPLCSYRIRQADRQPTLDLTAHALNSRAELQEAGQ